MDTRVKPAYDELWSSPIAYEQREPSMRIDAISIGNDPPREVNVIIEVPVGGEPIKYEMDKEAGTLVVDRFLYTAMRYPGNYGFIPHTLSDDGDPCDVLVANTRAIVPGAVMSVRPVGVLLMEDEAGGDEKIIAVPSSKLTQRYDRHQDLQRPARDHAAADPALLRALQGSRARQMGEGVALGRRRGCAQADRGRNCAGEGRSKPSSFRGIRGTRMSRNRIPRNRRWISLGDDHRYEQGLRLWVRARAALAPRTTVYTPGFGNPAIAQAARSVFTSRHATVIWPTPPGTGVIAPATCEASSNATSPTSLVLPLGRRAAG